MSDVFAIAVYFTPEARQAAVANHYTPPKGYTRGYRRDAYGRCPVGVMLQADGYGRHYTCPDSSYAASALIGRMEPIKGAAAGMERFRPVRTATAAFLAAWDAGDIDDLAVALDCQKTGPTLGSQTFDSTRKRGRGIPVPPRPGTGKIASKRGGIGRG